mgnify:FL=1
MILFFSWTLRVNNTGFIGTQSTQYFSLLGKPHTINSDMLYHMTRTSRVQLIKPVNAAICSFLHGRDDTVNTVNKESGGIFFALKET